MTPQASAMTVRHAITVEAPIDHAFAVYVEQGFVNTEHRIGDADMDRLVLEPHEGGRWYECSIDGTECDWGRVLAYEPPHRLVLGWQITPEFTPEPDPARASEVEIRFIAQTERRTRVELEHRALERHGDGWQALRDAVDAPDGWPDDLARFAAAASA